MLGLSSKLTSLQTILKKLFLEKFKLILGSELVTNGNFSATDGSSNSIANWTGPGSSLENGKLKLTVTGGGYVFASQPISYETGSIYQVSFTVNGTSGKIMRCRDDGGDNGGLTLSNGTVTLDGTDQQIKVTFVATSGSDEIIFERQSGGDYSFTIDNVSLKKVFNQAPVAAFSLRKLGKVSPYACRIRRSSDNTEAQVEFAGSAVSEFSRVRNTSMNLVNFSEDFGNSFWTKSGLTMVGGYSDPTGGTNAYKATPSTGSAFHFFHNSSNYTVVSGKTYTYSIHLKADGYNFVTLNAPTGNSKGDAGPRVNLSTGQKDGFYAADHDLQVEQLEDGWYRVSTQYVASGTSLRVDHGIFPTNAHSAYAGDGNSGVLFWGAQLEETTTYEAVGTEKVTDGGFDDASQWLKSSSITIASSEAAFISSAENNYLQQNIGAVNGRKYKVTVTVTDYTSGAITVRYPINKTSGADQINSVGTHTIEGVADQSNVNIQFQAKGTSTTLTIDNLSVLEHKPIPSEYISTPVVSNDGLTFTETTLGDFVGAGDAHVVTFYNQTGGEDIIQDDQNYQPKLYSSGQLVKVNGLPAIQFDGSDDVMKFSPNEFGNGLNLNSLSSFLVFKADDISTFRRVLNLGTDTNDKDWFLPFINNGDFVVRYGTNSNSGTTGNTNVNLMSGVAGLQSGKFKAFLNNTQIDIRDVENNSSDTGIASVGGLEGTSNQFEGKILEIIVFDTEQHTTREAIEADIAKYHKITLS